MPLTVINCQGHTVSAQTMNSGFALSLCFQQSLALNGSEGEVMVNKVSASKFLSLLLRHKPEEVGLVLDPDGWAEIDQIVERTVIPPFFSTRQK